MDNRLIGGILLIVGTAIGGGMLALPLATAQAGFVNSSLLLFGSWLAMTLSSLLVLEVNLWLPANSNLISMAKVTLGKPGTAVAWVSYLVLLYSLLSAYIAGGSDFLHNLLTLIHVDVARSVSALLFTLLFGMVVYFGIRSVDYVNRGLMITKFGTLIGLIFLILPHTTLAKLGAGETKYLTAGLTVMITSFGFASIVPSLRSYFHDDTKKLRIAILTGSLIPLIFYILWDMAIMGVMPLTGANSLTEMFHAIDSNSLFVNTLSNLLNQEIITVLARIFMSICLATSFLGVALSLSDFLADGLNITKVGKGNVIVNLITFLPPLFIVLFYPGAFIKGLSYAGVCCVILLLLMPALMAWSGRYYKKIANGYRLSGGKPLLIAIISVAIFIILHAMREII